MWWGGCCPLLCSLCHSGLWCCPWKFSQGLSCGKVQQGLTRQTPVDSRCWNHDLPVPGQHSSLSDLPGPCVRRLQQHHLEPFVLLHHVQSVRNTSSSHWWLCSTTATLIKNDKPLEGYVVHQHANPHTSHLENSNSLELWYVLRTPAKSDGTGPSFWQCNTYPNVHCVEIGSTHLHHKLLAPCLHSADLGRNREPK